MRILMVASPGAGHVFPIVPLAWALRSAGHDVLLATTGFGAVLGPGAGLLTVDVAPGVDIGRVFHPGGAAPVLTAPVDADLALDFRH